MKKTGWILTAAVLLFIFVTVSFQGASGQEKPLIIVGSKGFTEQTILGNMVALLMEDNGFRVDRKIGLGGSVICHEAIVRGDINVYVEYTGTALMAILKKPLVRDPDEAYQIVKKEYEERFKVTWLKPWGFNNTFVIAIRKADADRLKIKKISDLKPYAKDFILGGTIEFIARPDGASGLMKHYDLKFKDQKGMDFGLVYQAMAEKQVDVVSATATDGRIQAFDLVALEDDLRFFPPYYAAPVVRMDLLAKMPQVGEILNKLAGKISDSKMASLNYEVDGKKQVAEVVAKEFLKSQNYIK